MKLPICLQWQEHHWRPGQDWRSYICSWHLKDLNLRFSCIAPQNIHNNLPGLHSCLHVMFDRTTDSKLQKVPQNLDPVVLLEHMEWRCNVVVFELWKSDQIDSLRHSNSCWYIFKQLAYLHHKCLPGMGQIIWWNNNLWVQFARVTKSSSK